MGIFTKEYWAFDFIFVSFTRFNLEAQSNEICAEHSECFVAG